jgi:hypothetical protein
MIKLYEITTAFWGKDLNEDAILGYLLAESADDVYEHINKKMGHYGHWSESVNMTREEIIAAEGDFESDYMGEFYDQKYGWEDLGEITPEDIACLQYFKILPDTDTDKPAVAEATAEQES